MIDSVYETTLIITWVVMAVMGLAGGLCATGFWMMLIVNAMGY